MDKQSLLHIAIMESDLAISCDLLVTTSVVIRELSFNNCWKQLQTHSQTLDRAGGTLLKRGGKVCTSLRGQGHHKETHRNN